MHEGAQTLPSVVVEGEWRGSEEGGALVVSAFWQWSESAVLGGGGEEEEEAGCGCEKKVVRHRHGV